MYLLMIPSSSILYVIRHEKDQIDPQADHDEHRRTRPHFGEPHEWLGRSSAETQQKLSSLAIHRNFQHEWHISPLRIHTVVQAVIWDLMPRLHLEYLDSISCICSANIIHKTQVPSMSAWAIGEATQRQHRVVMIFVTTIMYANIRLHIHTCRRLTVVALRPIQSALPS